MMKTKFDRHPDHKKLIKFLPKRKLILQKVSYDKVDYQEKPFIASLMTYIGGRNGFLAVSCLEQTLLVSSLLVQRVDQPRGGSTT